MIKSNKRKASLIVFLAACIFVSVAATKPSIKTTINAVSTTDTGMWKNLKVLPKDISKDSLDHIMHGYSAALGVRCNFCHVFNGKPDFASDDKEEKNSARYMMTMTAGINKTYFNSENSTRPDTINVVQCVTCHHGNPHPDAAAMAMGNDNHGNTPPPPGMPMDSNHKMAPPPPNQ